MAENGILSSLVQGYFERHTAALDVVLPFFDDSVRTSVYAERDEIVQKVNVLDRSLRELIRHCATAGTSQRLQQKCVV
jgi:hypothetical protein